jgi:diguanylate cyclase (GGDEF)-like protein
MTRFEIKLYLTIAFAICVAGIFFYVNESNESLLISHAEVLHGLNDLELHNEKINEEALISAYRLYGSYDSINQQIQQLGDKVDEIANSPLFDDEIYQVVKDNLVLFKNALNEKEKSIYKFATLNSLIKNSATHVPSMTARYLQRFGFEDQPYLLEISKITLSIFQARNAMDADLIAGINESIDYLKTKHFEDEEMERFNLVFVSHAKVMQRYLPTYLAVFEDIVNNPMRALLYQVQESFIKISSAEAEKLRNLSNFVSVIFVSSILFIINLFFDLEKARKNQLHLTQQLEYRAKTDRLTSLKNRFAFEQEESGLVEICAMLLINVDGFKNINDFYGRELGDEYLKFLSGIVCQFRDIYVVHEIYRVGSDEFGVLVETRNRDRLIGLASRFIEKIESTQFTYQNIHLGIQVSIGVSTVLPLLEKADIALRKIKKTRNKFTLYEDDQSLEQQVKSNLTMMHFIREAIEHDYVEPHFMPIMNNADLAIHGYECLLRLRDKEGRLYYPSEFLHIAKEGRLYGQLTRIMFDKCMQKFIQNDYSFSINISIDDIEDDEVVDYLIVRLIKFPEVASRLTLEILESEGVKNYSVLQSFIERVKFCGCKIAIDDYGTGYSNLQHLVKLKVDSLKLDGSLIEPMTTDVSSFVAVRAIVEMAQDLGIQTTAAEFVSSEQVMQVVRSLGITLSQGYYIGRAAVELTEMPDFLK